jgi:short-subunit dehydrogenase
VDKKKRIVIVGATSAIAEHCARLWVQGKSVDLSLVGRDVARTERVADDLRVRSPQSSIRVVQAEFLDPNTIQAVVRAIVDQGAVDTVLIAHGSMPDQNICQSDLSVCREALEINGCAVC